MIYEDKNNQEASTVMEDINTPEQIERGKFYAKEYQMLYGEMQKRLEVNNVLEQLFRCEREITDENAPNTFIPIINPIIAGQIASLVEKNVQANVQGRGISDQFFARTGQILAELILRENSIKQKIKEIAKNYLLFGTSCIAVNYDPDKFRSGTGKIIGFPEIRIPELSRIFVDGKIKNLSDFQKAEWVIEEIGFKSISWIRRKFGDDIANAVTRLNHAYPMDGDVSHDDINASSVLYVWTKENKEGNLQRIVMDKRGMIFEESDPKSPYFDYINNEYPYTFCGLYKQEGKFYRFGDGLLLKPVQEIINNLYDELVLACKFASQGRTFIDPNAQCDPDQFDNDPSHPIMCREPSRNVFSVTPASVNAVVERLIAMLMNEAHKMTRFDSLMNGSSPEETMTATQVGVQVQQGNNTINDKRLDISEAVSWAVGYSIGLLMEFWPAAEALRVTENENEFEWVEPKKLASIPVIKPVDEDYINEWKKQNPQSPVSEVPQWMQLDVDTGEVDDEEKPILEPATKSIDFDIKITIGEGLPTNKIALYNILLSLSQLALIDEQTGQPRPIIGYQQFKKMAEDLLGLNLNTDIQMTAPMQTQKQGPLNISQSIPGGNISGINKGGGGALAY